ncbi:MAG: hypothetical protein PSU94_11635 [Lacunisphaera sp.]|nr:hypothetical protein [Lacunisphaera sp.]
MSKPKFCVALNISRLYPKDIDYWKNALLEICDILAGSHGIVIEGLVGAFVVGSGDAPEFFLISLPLDLADEGDALKITVLESQLRALIRKYALN